MRDNSISPEQRQHVNLSQYAYDVIRNDSINFLGKLNISGFINTIIENSKVESFDDMSLMEEERILQELSESKTTLSATELKALHKIAEAHRNKLILSYKKYPKDKALKIRLNNKLHEEFYPSDSKWHGLEFGITQGEYIKTIVEEYARKTYYERECVFYKSRIDELTKNIASLDSEKRILSITMKNDVKYYCKLYRMSENYETHYHFLIGLFAKDGSTDYKIASIRLSRIAEIKSRGRSLGSGKLTHSEIKKIENRIKESNIPYIIGEPKDFVIQLTSKGMILYDFKYSQRPIYDELIVDKQNDKFTMKIFATERQITNYFIGFGKEAIVLSPSETKNWICEKYSEAAVAYT